MALSKPPFSLLFITFLSLFAVMKSDVLSPTFYKSSCPEATLIVQAAVSFVVAEEPRMGASLLRLHFHDCFVNGCDASVLLDDEEGEKGAIPNNNSLRGFDVIDNIKTQLEDLCPRVVSCSDILTLAARDSVVALGGPNWTVALGRRDAIVAANKDDVSLNIPSPFSNLSTLISDFSKKGLTIREMVALSGNNLVFIIGAHTIGEAHCRAFRGRLYNDTNLNSTLAEKLRLKCPRIGGNDNLSSLDTNGDPNTFGRAYFSNLKSQTGLLHSDQELFNGGGGPTDALVITYSSNSRAFFRDFAKAMVKMGNLGPLTGTIGEIRENCRRRN